MAATYSVPGVYREPRPRSEEFPRVRTDVAGFVGIAGPNRLNEPVRLDDWRSYEQVYLRDAVGDPVEPPRGSQLAAAVRAFFTNGGARCVVVNVAEAVEESLRLSILQDTLGIPRDPPATDSAGAPVKHSGLEALLLVEQVSIVALPDLFALKVDRTPREATDLPPLFEQGDFFDCSRARLVDDVPPGALPPDIVGETWLYQPDEIQAAQRHLIERCARIAWRVFALVEPLAGLTPQDALDWRALLPKEHCAACYWPWPLTQPVPGSAVTPRPPCGAVAGVFARRDLALGPHVAPANEDLRGVVGLERSIDDRLNAGLYDAGINVLRAFPGAGIHVWGARTLAWETPVDIAELRSFVSVRRCLSAIERSVERLGQRIVFEPNRPLLRLQLTQAIISYLMNVFRSGALAGVTPEESFFVRCDAGLNPPQQLALGRLVCEVGVAIAAPAEFVVFRVGRAEGVVEIEEV